MTCPRYGLAAALVLLAGCHGVRSRELSFDGSDDAGRVSSIAQGERLSHVLGCVGCHGAGLVGNFQTKYEPQYGPLYASNLTVAVPKYSDEQLDGIIRHGIHPRRPVMWQMPSEIFQNLSDPDFDALIAYLRTLKPTGSELPAPRLSRQDRRDIAAGLYQPAGQRVAAYRTKQPADLGPQYALGRYISTVSCEECHGSDLHGDDDRGDKAPDLNVVGAYSRAAFDRLVTTGVPTPARKLNPMMYYAAIGRFSHLTPHERGALYDYLRARAQNP